MSGNFTAPKRVPPELVKSSIIKMWSCIKVSRWRWAPSFTHQQLRLFTVWQCIFTIRSMKKIVFLYLIVLSSFQGFCCWLSLNKCIVSDSKRIAGLLDFVWCILRTRELVKIAYTIMANVNVLWCLKPRKKYMSNIMQSEKLSVSILLLPLVLASIEVVGLLILRP